MSNEWIIPQTKFRYIGATNAQVNWGDNDDPRDILEEGEVYELYEKEIHSSHTKYYLVGFEKYGFNSVHFEAVD